MDSPGITQCCPRSSLPRLRLSLWWAWHLNSVPRPSMTGTCSHWLWVKTLVPKRYPKIAGWWMMMDGYSPKYGFSWVLTQPLFFAIHASFFTAINSQGKWMVPWWSTAGGTNAWGQWLKDPIIRRVARVAAWWFPMCYRYELIISCLLLHCFTICHET